MITINSKLHLATVSCVNLFIYLLIITYYQVSYFYVFIPGHCIVKNTTLQKLMTQLTRFLHNPH